MQIRFVFQFAPVFLLLMSTAAAGQSSGDNAAIEVVHEMSPSAIGTQSSATNANPPQTARSTNEIIDRVFKQEHEQRETIESYAPIVETYIQLEKSDALMGTAPKSDLYFLGIADFRGKTMKVHSMTEKTYKGSILWSFEPAGFLQMSFLDLDGFDKEHYVLKPAGRAFLGEVRCYVFDVARTPNAKGPRFRGRIWVEDQDFTIVRMNGDYAPEINFSLKHVEDEYYLHFDSWRTNVRSHLWLPSDIFSQEISDHVPTGGPRFKARTHLWGYGLTTRNRQEELGRLLVESENNVKDESERQDPSPLEQQRGWRQLSENNVLDVLERVGLVAPQGEVEKVLNTIVNNIMVTNNIDSRVELHCRVLMTSDFEMFSMQNTIVLSRGLIDIVPNEETLAALLAFEIADAMVPKPDQDQYGFSDILRLTPTEALKKLSFVDKPEEAKKKQRCGNGIVKEITLWKQARQRRPVPLAIAIPKKRAKAINQCAPRESGVFHIATPAVRSRSRPRQSPTVGRVADGLAHQG